MGIGLLAMTGKIWYNTFMTPKRKCSVCRRPGHTKKNCPKSAVGETKNTIGKMVLVNVAKAHIKSQHTVDLSGKMEKPEWLGVGVFQEAPRARESRQVIDWAQMVREANGKSNRLSVISDQYKQEKISVLACMNSWITDHRLPVINFVRKCVYNIKTSLVRVSGSVANSFNYRRLAYAAVAMFLLVAIPFPAIGYYQKLKSDGAQVVSESTNAFLALQSSTIAALQANLGQAQSDLNSALQSFSSAQNILEKEHGALMYVAGLLPILGNEVRSRENLLVAGHHLALGNTYLIKGVSETTNDSPLLTRLDSLANHLRSAIPQYKEALAELAGVDAKSLPVEYQQSFSDFKLLFATFIDDMNDLQELSRSLNYVFGGDQPRRYLLVFQNNAEIRPTGGFLGSFGILDAQKGKIVNLDIPGGGTYDLKGQLDVFVAPPLPLQIVNKRWEFQDSNWFPDFSVAGQKMEWFYQHGRGATVDGVIALNATVLERLLRVLGPMQSEKFGMEVAGNNALNKIQKQVEVDYNKYENKPKEIISDLAGSLLTRAGELNLASAVKILTELQDAFNQKEIQVYFKDALTQARFQEFGWTGELSKIGDDQDYLMVVDANLGGNKSDARVEETIDHQAVVQDDGSVINSVVIKRNNLGRDGEMFYGGNNVDYVRVYVPEGAELIDAGGFNYPPEEIFNVPEEWYKTDADLIKNEKEVAIHAKTGTRITNEFGKTAFGNWCITAPGQISSVYFTYRLPFKVIQDNAVSQTRSFWTAGMSQREASRYSLLWQKQSGTESHVTSRVIYPTGWTPAYGAGDDMTLAINGAEFSGDLKMDKVIGVVMELL